MPFLAAAAPIIGAVGTAASAGIGIAGAAGAFNPSAPKSRSEAAEYTKTLRAQIAVMPEWLKAEQAYRPKFAQLDVDVARQTMPQVLDLYRQAQPTLSDLEQQSKEAQVAADMGILDRYAGDVSTTLRRASGNDNLMRLLTQDAEASLSGDVDPYLMEQAAQRLRAGQAARGMLSAGMPAASAEALFGAERANAIRNQNRAFASQVVGLNQATGGDPLLALLSRPSGTMSAAGNVLGASSGYNPGNLFSVQNPYAQDVYNTNYNANAAARTQGANTQAASMAGLMNLFGNLGSSGLYARSGN